MTNHANDTHQILPGWPQAAPGVAPPERPEGSYVKLTRTSWDGRPVVSILVREDNPDNPDEPHRWRAAEGNSRWLTWQDLHAAGRVDPLYSHAELTAAAAGAARSPATAAEAVAPAHPYQQPRTPQHANRTTSTTSVTIKDEHRTRAARAASPAAPHRASRPHPPVTPAAHQAGRLDSRPKLAAAPADHPVRKASP